MRLSTKTTRSHASDIRVRIGTLYCRHGLWHPLAQRTPRTAATPTAQADPRSDSELVAACLAGHDEAWSALIGRYKRLIYSVPFRYGATPDDAADIAPAR